MITNEETLNKVNIIFKDVLENDELEIKADSTANDVHEWDSLSHIQLIVAIEKFFKIRFTSSEINNFQNVGEMCVGITKKLKG